MLADAVVSTKPVTINGLVTDEYSKLGFPEELRARYCLFAEPIVNTDRSYISEARDVKTNEPVMVKIYRSKDLSCIYLRLMNINYVSWPYIHYVKYCNGNTYIVEEKISGQVILGMLNYANRQGRYLDEDTVSDIISSLCDAVSVLHKFRPPIIHRDIKPTNVMITDNCQVKLIDFDIAREYKDSANRDTTLIGTRQYASPEQLGLAQFGQTDARSDIYSIGIMMHEMLTGILPDYCNCSHDGYLKPVIEKCIQLNAVNRYQSVDELKQAINLYRHNDNPEAAELGKMDLGTDVAKNELLTRIMLLARNNKLPGTIMVNDKSVCTHDKLVNARNAYASHGEDEIDLVLKDDSIFGKGGKGFLLTNRMLYAKESFSPTASTPIKDIKCFGLEKKDIVVYPYYSPPFNLTRCDKRDTAIRLVSFLREVIQIIYPNKCFHKDVINDYSARLRTGQTSYTDMMGSLPFKYRLTWIVVFFTVWSCICEVFYMIYELRIMAVFFEIVNIINFISSLIHRRQLRKLAGHRFPYWVVFLEFTLSAVYIVGLTLWIYYKLIQ